MQPIHAESIRSRFLILGILLAVITAFAFVLMRPTRESPQPRRESQLRGVGRCHELRMTPPRPAPVEQTERVRSCSHRSMKDGRKFQYDCVYN